MALQTFIILISITTIKSKKISCSKPHGCEWNCADHKCDGNIYHCPGDASSCTLNCISCENIQIHSSSAQFTISCAGDHACDDINITADTVASNIYLQCDAHNACSDITFHCNTPENCQCVDNGHNLCLPPTVRGGYTIKSQLATTSVIGHNIIPIYTSMAPNLYVGHDEPPSDGHLTIIIIVLSTALVFAVSACVYMSIRARKSSAKHEETEANEDSYNGGVEYSDVNLNVNRLNSMNSNIHSVSPKAKRTIEGIVFVKESMESMYGECNNAKGHTMHTKRVSSTASNKFSNTASEGNMHGYYESDRNGNDECEIWEKSANSKQEDWVLQTAPIMVFQIE